MPSMNRVAGCLLAALLGLSFAPVATGRDDQAARFYEDARSRLGKGDTAGAIIQLKNALREDSSLLAAQALLGQAFMRNQQPDQAQEALERAIALGIDKSEVALTLAEALLAQGKVRDLIDRLPPDVVQGTARADLLVLRGHAFRQLGEPSTAERSFEQARAIDPSSVNALLSLAEHIGQRGQRDEALVLVGKAAGIAPDNPKVWFVKGTLLQQGGDRAGAIAAYSRSLTLQPRFADARVARVSLLLGQGDDAAVMRDLDYFAKEQPDEPRGNYLRAVRLGQKGDGEGARAALAAAARVLAPVPPEVLKRRAPELLMLSALVFHGLNEHERARAYLDAVLGVAPGDLAALKLLGSIYLGEQDFVSAVKVLEPAQRKAPSDPQLMLLLGEAYMGRGRVSAAAELLERAFRLRGGNAEIQTAYGVSLLRGGQRDAGVQQLRGAFDKDPGQARAGMALAVAYLASGDGKRATAVMERVVQRSPDNPAYLNTLGVLRQASGDRAGSRAAYEGALGVAPGFVPARLNLGRLDVQEGRFDAAAARYAALLKDDPKSVQTMHEFALLELRRGQAAAARQWLEKGHAADPAFRPVAFALIDAHLESKQPAKALEIIRDLEGRAPEDLDVLARGVRVRLATGDQAGAQSVLARMTRLAQVDPERQVEIARLQLAAGNPSAAAYSLDKALAGRPDDLAAQVLFVDVDLLRGQTEAADRRARALVSAHPGRGVGYRLLGDILFRSGRAADAVAQYRLAFAKEQSSEHALRVFAGLVRTGAMQQAVAFLEPWANRHPNDLGAARAMAEGQLKARNYPAARSRLEALLRLRPDDPVVLNNLANVAALQGDKSKAVGFAERAVKVAPEDAGARDTLGWLLVQTGARDAGLRHLREARLRDPRNAETRYHLAAALAQAGQNKEAADELKGIFAAPLDFSEAADAEALGRRLGVR